MDDQILPRITRILADLFALDPGDITPTASPETIEEWDSLQHLNLVLALEQEFGVTLPPEEIAELTDLETISRRLRQLLDRTP